MNVMSAGTITMKTGILKMSYQVISSGYVNVDGGQLYVLFKYLQFARLLGTALNLMTGDVTMNGGVINSPNLVTLAATLYWNSGQIFVHDLNCNGDVVISGNGNKTFAGSTMAITGNCT